MSDTKVYLLDGGSLDSRGIGGGSERSWSEAPDWWGEAAISYLVGEAGNGK